MECVYKYCNSNLIISDFGAPYLECVERPGADVQFSRRLELPDVAHVRLGRVLSFVYRKPRLVEIIALIAAMALYFIQHTPNPKISANCGRHNQGHFLWDQNLLLS